jgi:uncharacterized Zn finger protein (UPF0148 family)
MTVVAYKCPECGWNSVGLVYRETCPNCGHLDVENKVQEEKPEEQEDEEKKKLLVQLAPSPDVYHDTGDSQ